MRYHQNKKTPVKLNLDVYRDKVYACWLGKNIGGTMGAPYEGVREMLDVKGYATEANVVLPNDDLDLQLVWLYAVEQLGPQAINALTLGEFWLSYIVPYWNEYGIGKINMKKGLLPPLCGDYENEWKHSNGAWIRTEVWACMAPGCPDVAARYAMEDGKVDHGAGEGTYAAIFVAAMQSAAFILNDFRKCIEVGLSAIPADCRVAQSVKKTIECYDNGLPAMETRNIILESNADIGDGWFEAPSNVAYSVLGLLYGEGDFKKTMLTAINCGDDTDCTAATVGATLGILGGSSVIPEDWKKHIGDDIVTISLNRGTSCRNLPNTCTELSERVIAQAPHVLFANRAPVTLTEGASEIPENEGDILIRENQWFFERALNTVKPNTIHMDFSFLSVDVTLDGDPQIEPMGEKKLKIKIVNNYITYDNGLYNLNLRWWLPDGFTVEGRKDITLPHHNAHNPGNCETEITVKAGEMVEAENRLVLEIYAKERVTPMYIPIVVLG